MNEQNIKHGVYQIQVNIFYQKLLQCSALELMQICENSAEENPMLEFEKIYSDDYSFSNYVYEKIPARQSFNEDLKRQLAYMNLEPSISEIAMMIVDLIDRDGFLRFSVDEIAGMIKRDVSLVKKALTAIHSLEPPGIGARDFFECLILQMKAKHMENSIAFKIISEYGNELLAGKFSHIKKQLDLTDYEFSSAIEEISKLNPFPARACVEPDEIIPRFPDIIIKCLEPDIKIEFGEEKIFKIYLNEKYINFLKSSSISTSEKHFLSEKLNQARSFLAHVENRKNFLEKIIKYLVGYQKHYLLGKGALNPITEKDLAEKFTCSPSLISRSIAGKYINWGSGIFRVKELFSYSYCEKSQDFIIDAIEDIIKNSDTSLSDRKISEELKKRGISIAPRTVNKYRRKREIFNSYIRRSMNLLENKQ